MLLVLVVVAAVVLYVLLVRIVSLACGLNDRLDHADECLGKDEMRGDRAA